MSTCSFHKRHWVVESDVKTAYPVLGGLKACNVLSIQFLDFYNLQTQIWDGFIAPDILLLMPNLKLWSKHNLYYSPTSNSYLADWTEWMTTIDQTLLILIEPRGIDLVCNQTSDFRIFLQCTKTCTTVR